MSNKVMDRSGLARLASETLDLFQINAGEDGEFVLFSTVVAYLQSELGLIKEDVMAQHVVDLLVALEYLKIGQPIIGETKSRLETHVLWPTGESQVVVTSETVTSGTVAQLVRCEVKMMVDSVSTEDVDRIAQEVAEAKAAQKAIDLATKTAARRVAAAKQRQDRHDRAVRLVKEHIATCECQVERAKDVLASAIKSRRGPCQTRLDDKQRALVGANEDLRILLAREPIQ